MSPSREDDLSYQKMMIEDTDVSMDDGQLYDLDDYDGLYDTK